MAQFAAWFANLFSSAPTRGLSGDRRKITGLGPPDTFYNARMFLHRVDGDFVETPALLWSARDPGGKRVGLRAHLMEQRGVSDTAQFTDVLVILNADDHRRVFDAAVAEPWEESAARLLRREFERYCDDEGFQVLRASRPVRFGFVADGGPELGGTLLDLEPGEFVTGLLPNYYTEPAPASRPVIGVHLNIPGAWEGYREVGTLFSDQLMFTIGNSPLDNFSHGALSEPALYRLQQYLDGTFVHIVTPDGERSYQVSSDEEAGPAVLTVSRDDGMPVAYLVLAVLEASIADPPTRDAPPPVVPELLPATDVVIEESLTVDQVDARDLSLPPSPPPREPRRTISANQHRTIVPETIRERILTLRERGALLQRVHFSRFMLGYDVYITASGQLSTNERSPAATFQVRGRAVRLVVQDRELRLGGAPARLGVPLDLGPAVMIEVAGARLEYRDLSNVDLPGWPYLAEIRRTTGSSHMVFGGRYRVGRDRRSKVRLPDDPHNNNIHWDPNSISGGTIRTRSGEVPQSKFYTDSIMVASEHAEFDLRDEPVLNNIARLCYSFVRRGDEIFPLHPTEGKPGPRELQLQPGDEILVGNCLFQASFPRPEPERRMSASSLARATDSMTEEQLAADAPPAAGLGEAATAPPPPPKFEGVSSYDSIISDIEPLSAPPAAGLGEEGGGPPPPPRPFGEATPYDSIIGTPESVLGQLINPDIGPDDTAEVLAFLPGLESPPPPVLPAAPPPAPRLEDTPTELPEPPAYVPTFDGLEEVAWVDESEWMLELARPARLVLVGWMIAGEVLVGNHPGAGVVIPESRAEPDQQLTLREYLRLEKVRGRRGSAWLLDAGEARLLVGGEEVPFSEKPDDLTLEVIRRDVDGEEDFRVVMQLVRDPGLPDPRARMLTVNTEDRLVAALFTRGLPLHAARRLSLGPLAFDALFDGDSLTVSNYLPSYRTPAGFRPFFVRRGKDAFRTVPEDGQPLTLSAGDRLIFEGAIYEFQVI
jgi:hypothetical protein